MVSGQSSAALAAGSLLLSTGSSIDGLGSTASIHTDNMVVSGGKTVEVQSGESMSLSSLSQKLLVSSEEAIVLNSDTSLASSVDVFTKTFDVDSSNTSIIARDSGGMNFMRMVKAAVTFLLALELLWHTMEAM